MQLPGRRRQHTRSAGVGIGRQLLQQHHSVPIAGSGEGLGDGAGDTSSAGGNSAAGGSSAAIGSSAADEPSAAGGTTEAETPAGAGWS